MAEIPWVTNYEEAWNALKDAVSKESDERTRLQALDLEWVLRMMKAGEELISLARREVRTVEENR